LAREQGVEAPFPVPDEAFMVIALAEGSLNGIHGTVQYPPAFGAVAE
jgi:putative acetyltransferase